MTSVPHLGFIVAAYAVTATVLGGTILALVLDRRSQRRLLDRLTAPRDTEDAR